jgi:hypothetical protein
MATLRLRHGDEAIAYLPACGVVARYRDRAIPVLCWARLSDDRIIGLVYDRGQIRDAEDMTAEHYGNFIDFDMSVLAGVGAHDDPPRR